MAIKSLKEVLKKQAEQMTPSKNELLEIGKKTAGLINNLKIQIKKFKISADVFIGGSFSKNTIIKKNKYDVDIYVRFDKKYGEEELSKLLYKIVPKNSKKIHGSRDYFSLKDKENSVEFEIIPVVRIKKPEEARNITDLSYFHVNYVVKKIKKDKNLANEIRLAKAFAYYQDCYGAESYIQGFSGYGVELLILHYNRFLKFIDVIAKFDSKSENKIIIDDEKKFKNKEAIMRELNEAKLLSPIVLIDPTYKQRNALAALSQDTFIKFKQSCEKFIKHPSDKFFSFENTEEKMTEKYRGKLIKLKLFTEKQAGDIAGTKLKKFYGFFLSEMDRYFNIKAKDFIYDEQDNAGKILIAVESKKEIIFPGPPIQMKEALSKFKKEHKKIKIVKGKAQASEKPVEFDEFLRNFLNQRSRVIHEMDITRIEKLH